MSTASCFGDLLTQFARLQVGSTYPAPAPRSQSADTTSSVYPNRPIRPLPKRRLRSRLAPDVADSILYPPAPSTSTPLFYFPYSYADPSFAKSTQASQQCIAQDGHERRHQEDDLDSEEEDGGLARRHQSAHNLFASSTPHTCRGNAQPHQLKVNISATLPMPKPQGPNSTTSSADGYESFENTNNKKKRKIPTPGNASGHQSHLSADLANLGISSPNDVGRSSHDDLDNGGGGQHFGSSSTATSSTSGNGMSGSGYGRGRPSRRGYGGKLNANYGGRSPLGVSTNGLNGLSSGNTMPQRERVSLLRPQNTLSRPNTVTESDGQGIISAAIARTAEKRVELPAKGQENVSLLQQPSKAQPNKTQFTFTYESPHTTTINFTAEERSRRLPTSSSSEPVKSRITVRNGHPGPGTASGPGHLGRGMATQGTQTSPDMAGVVRRSTQGPEPSGGQSQAQQPHGTNQPAAQQQKKPRPRRTGKEYALEAGRRRLQQEYNNYRNPPTSTDDIWICEFCEYESIFGEPPEALMRQYEIKDRKERRRMAEKRKLLEKAKMKGRKGKKGSKAAVKNSGTTATNQQQQQQQQQHSVDQGQTHSQSTQSEEYMADEVEGDTAMATVPQAAVKGAYSGGVQHGKSLTRNPTGPAHSTTAACGGGGGTTAA
ncbi:hypothetical protein GP486_004533 [Trichoglossum hirsutum]|uniref:Uncharacterized protein n=1 Tax=Trichoglossum hirsutum TaxID=265104 RepID=A0A9P8LAP7_9PEZI|nr:hypothetical protein GP486_004533 [Trichoglossum hirsutum]